MPVGPFIGVIVVAGLLILSVIILFLTRYKKCPSDKIMVIYGKVGKDKDGKERSAICIHGGAAFIVPVFQAYQFLDLNPISYEIELTDILLSDDGTAEISARMTVGISVEPDVMQNAAERLLGLPREQIKELACDITTGRFREYFETRTTEALQSGRGRILEQVCKICEDDFKLIGLRIINLNIKRLKINQ